MNLPNLFALLFAEGEGALARYYFQVKTSSHMLADEGLDLSSLDDARLEAARRIGELLKVHAGLLWADQDWNMAVTDETGLILFSIQVAAMDSPSISRGAHRC